MLRKMLSMAVALSLACGAALAAPVAIGPVYISSVGVVQGAGLGHLSGNLEITIQGGFQLPAGVQCDTTYLTTLKSVDVDKSFFILATLAQVKKLPMHLYITDDPAVTAYPGRCSLVAATIIAS